MRKRKNGRESGEGGDEVERRGFDSLHFGATRVPKGHLTGEEYHISNFRHAMDGI